MTTPSEHFMLRCIRLALNGLGTTSPNPMVGAVIVHNDIIIGEGFHRAFGQLHAEPEAINKVSQTELLPYSTLYVNLEPCGHHGKTPPCAQAIINSGIRSVVIGASDPNPLVRGRGVSMLREAGVSVIEGVCLKEARHLNRRFFTFHEKLRPFVLLKWAVSADGFMDIERNGEKGIHWISSAATRKLVHLRRSQESAILIGAGTAAVDDPALSVREVRGRQPLRILIDPNLTVNPTARLLTDGMPTIVYSRLKRSDEGEVKYRLIKPEDTVRGILDDLYVVGVSSVMVEGGQNTLARFIESELWDEAMVIRSLTRLGKGLAAPQIGTAPNWVESYASDAIETYLR